MSSTLSPSGLRKLDTNDENDWQDDVLYNITRLNNTLLKLSQMGDVDVINLGDGDGLRWDSVLSKYVKYTPTTTTTTTTSTTSTSSSTTTTTV